MIWNKCWGNKEIKLFLFGFLLQAILNSMVCSHMWDIRKCLFVDSRNTSSSGEVLVLGSSIPSSKKSQQGKTKLLKDLKLSPIEMITIVFMSPWAGGWKPWNKMVKSESGTLENLNDIYFSYLLCLCTKCRLLFIQA